MSPKRTRRCARTSCPASPPANWTASPKKFIRENGALPMYKGYGAMTDAARLVRPRLPGDDLRRRQRRHLPRHPQRQEVLQEGDIIGIDIGVLYEGWVGDSCRTFAVGTIDKESRKLVDAAERCLELGIAQAQPGRRIGDIGAAIQQYAEGAGLLASCAIWRPWRRTRAPGRAVGAPLRQGWHRHADSARDGLHHRADDQRGRPTSHDGRRRLDRQNRGWLALGAVRAYAGDHRNGPEILTTLLSRDDLSAQYRLQLQHAHQRFAEFRARSLFARCDIARKGRYHRAIDSPVFSSMPLAMARLAAGVMVPSPFRRRAPCGER